MLLLSGGSSGLCWAREIISAPSTLVTHEVALGLHPPLVSAPFWGGRREGRIFFCGGENNRAKPPRASGHWVPVCRSQPIMVLSPSWRFLAGQCPGCGCYCLQQVLGMGRLCLGKHKELLALAEHNSLQHSWDAQ